MSRREKASERKAFKDYFDRAAARSLGAQIKGAMARFDEAAFVKAATRRLADLTFQQRVQQFSDALAATLPSSVPRALGIVVDSLPPPLPDCEAVTDGWLQWPLGQFIADHGLDHFDASMTAMIELTQRFSSEFAVRPFVESLPEPTFARLATLTSHPSPHVRRWCSEGTRPRLPWGKKLTALVARPDPIWPILDALRADPERYVQRSVANNLNDIAKDHPDAVVDRCRVWGSSEPPVPRSLIDRALRTLVKDGHADALAVVGYRAAEGVTARLSVRPRRVSVGESVTLVADLTNALASSQSLMIDYAVHFVRSNGAASPKVFKWTRAEIEARGRLRIEKRHALKVTTIRALYPGRHVVSMQVNGQSMAETSFHLLAESF